MFGQAWYVFVSWLFLSFPAVGYEIICPEERKFNYAFNIFGLVGNMHLVRWKQDGFIYNSYKNYLSSYKYDHNLLYSSENL